MLEKESTCSPLHHIAGRAVDYVVCPDTGRWAYIEKGALPVLGSASSMAGYTEIPPESTIYRFLEDGDLFTGGYSHPNTAPLDTLIVKLTTRCNEACVYCYDATERRSTDIATADASRMIDEALKLCAGQLTIIFHGGEPLLRFSDLVAIVTDAKQQASRTGAHLRFAIQTNGSIFSDRIVEFLASNDFDIGISLDGPQELHDELRLLKNGSGSYALFSRHLETYGEFIRKHCGILTTVTSRNAKMLPEIVRFFRENGFVSWNATLFDCIGKGSKLGHLHVATDDYINSITAIAMDLAAGNGHEIAVKPVLAYLDNLLLDTRDNMCFPGSARCGAASRLMSIDADGTISGCDILPRQYSLGTLSTGLCRAYCSIDAMNLRTQQSKLDQCYRCTWLGMCGGACMARWNSHYPNEVDCRASKHLFPYFIELLHEDNQLLAYWERYVNRRRANDIWHHNIGLVDRP